MMGSGRKVLGECMRTALWDLSPRYQRGTPAEKCPESQRLGRECLREVRRKMDPEPRQRVRRPTENTSSAKATTRPSGVLDAEELAGAAESCFPPALQPEAHCTEDGAL